MTRVSIIIPLYNKAPFIEETLRSIASQTHADFECIVVDNGSTDDGAARVSRFDDSRIRLGSYTKSQGPGGARNAGLEEARGDWILFLDADDLIEPEHLSKLLLVSEQNPNATLVAGNWIEKGADLSDEATLKLLPSRADLEEAAIAMAPWAIHAAIVKRDTTPRWPEELDALLGEDIAFWFAAIQKNTVVYSDSATAIYRTQTESCRSQYGDAPSWFNGVDTAIEQNIHFAKEISPLQCEHLVRAYQKLYQTALQKGDPRSAEQSLTKARFWLKRRSEFSHPMPRNIRLRLWLGIPLYDRLTSAPQKLKGLLWG